MGVPQLRFPSLDGHRVWQSVGSCGRTLANPLLTLLTRHHLLSVVQVLPLPGWGGRRVLDDHQVDFRLVGDRVAL